MYFRHLFFLGFQKHGAASGTLTPKTLNSLTAIAGHEGDEDEWEREIGGYNAHDEAVRFLKCLPHHKLTTIAGISWWRCPNSIG